MSNSEKMLAKYTLENDVRDHKFPINLNGHVVQLAFVKFEGELDADVKKSKGKLLVSHSNNQCDNCGERIEKLVFDERGVTYEGEKCKFAKGLKYEFYLNVPSGKMVVANDLRRLFPIMGNYFISYSFNMLKTSHKYASVGLAHAFVGNTCPGMYKVDKKTFAIGNKGKQGNPIKGAKEVAGICTDLWWYSICDYDQYMLKNKNNGDFGVQIVDCEPGYYKFTHLYHLCKHDNYSDTHLYTKIKWVSKPKPVIDYEAEFMKLDVTAEQIVADLIKEYPTLYKTPEDAAKSLISRSGFREEFHPNGWIAHNPDLNNDSPSVEIPDISTPLSGHYIDQSEGLAQFAGVAKPKSWEGNKKFKLINLNPSFTKLTFNGLRAALLYGFTKHESCNKLVHEKAPDWILEGMKALAKRYPDRVPENCKEFLGSDDV